MNINYMAPLGNTGYGIAGRNILNALCKDNVNVALFSIGQITHPENPEYEIALKKSIENNKSFDYNAPCLRIWHQFSLGEFIGRGRHIGFPIFELDAFAPNEKHHLRYPDHLFVCSHWAKNIIQDQLGDIPTEVIPLGIDPNIFYACPPKTHGPYTFINIGKWEKRKGHDILVELFNQAFTPQDDVRLILMPHNPFLNELEVDNWKSLYYNTPMGNRINIIPHMHSHKAVANIIMQADCGIFPSRAEGWNLELLETMSLGKPVIATNYSAHTEYCNNNNAFLIDIDHTEQAHDGKWFFGQGNWAAIGNKQLDQCIEYMRYVYKNRPYNQYGVKTGQKYTWQHSAKNIINYCNNN